MDDRPKVGREKPKDARVIDTGHPLGPNAVSPESEEGDGRDRHASVSEPADLAPRSREAAKITDQNIGPDRVGQTPEQHKDYCGQYPKPRLPSQAIHVKHIVLLRTGCEF